MLLGDRDDPTYRELQKEIDQPAHLILHTPGAGDNEGFYMFMCQHGSLPGSEWIKFFLGRLARLDPKGNPRDLVEWLSAEIYRYECDCRARKRRYELRALRSAQRKKEIGEGL